MKKFPIIILTLLAAVLLGYLVTNQIQPSRSESQIPKLTLTDYQSQPVPLNDFSGTPIILNSWAGWCPFCKKELVDFAVAQDQLGTRVKIIAIDRAESLAIAKKFSDELAVSNRLIMLLDPSDAFYKAIGGFSMPETIFVNAAGQIVDHKRGPMALDEILNRAAKILP